MHRTLSPFASAALASFVAFGLAGCGGKHHDDDYTPPDSGSAGGREQALGFGSFGGPPIIDKAPAHAVVGLGSGVSFSVVAHAPQGDFISGYRWRRGTTILKTGPDTSLAIPATTSSDQGGYTVEVLGSGGSSTTSPAATLSVVSGAWAPLAGRALSSDATAQQPALSLCGDTPKLAWIKTNAAGIDEIRVSHFNGIVWLPLGNALNVNAGESAAEPSIDCSDYSGTPRPVVAWSEGIGNARTIRVKAFDGTGWVSVGSSVAPSGVNARKPVLRLASAGGLISTRHVHARSSLAWLEAGAMRTKFWNGGDWQTYTNGFPSGTGLAELALTIDYEHLSGAAHDFTPLFAWIGSLAGGRTPVAAEANVGGWVALGLSPSSATPAATDLRIAGIGFGRDSGLGLDAGGAVAVWTAGSASYSIGSSRLSGSAYDTELSNPFAPAPAWQAYASAPIGTGLLATSFDPRELKTQCPLLARRPSFALAVNDSRGTTVLTTRCINDSAPLDWMPLAPTRPGPAESLSLRTKTDALGATIPVYAAVERVVNNRFELAVYQYFP